MPEAAANVLKFFHAVQRGMRASGGKALPPLIKRWRYTQSSDFAELVLKPPAARFLIRYGLLDAGDEAATRERRYRELLTRVARASGDAPGLVGAWVNLFAAGEYGVVRTGICGEEPQCAACTLKDDCRYLAAGAQETRSFGESLADDLLIAAEDRPGEHTAAQLLA